MTSKFSPTLILVAFTAAVFSSALLLFAVQPMFTRMVLPNLGGSPSVWSVAMVFFQSMLLAGYAYAHYLMKAKRPAIVTAVHVALMVAAGLTLPLSIARGWGEPPQQWEALWLVGLFAGSIGLPFFALSANNPLLQAWFVRTGHPDGNDPYFLYAASNVGSFLALLSYPVLVEPVLSLRAQTLLWTGGYWVLFALIGACAFLLLRSPDAEAAMRSEAAPAPSWRAIGRWVFLAAVPSGLLIAVTAHISTDVAAAPLLWVIPLSLYLLTWVLVFQRRPLLPHRWMLFLQPFAIVGLVALLMVSTTNYLMLDLLGHLLAFFIIAMACHGELARQRPPAEYLTTFYVALSAGGMIGGLFAGLIAPYAFSWVAEYPILIVLAVLCLPLRPIEWDRGNVVFWFIAAVVGAAILVPGLIHGWTPEDKETTLIQAAIIGIACGGALILMFRGDPYKFAFAVAIALAMVRVYPGDEVVGMQTVRSFFGVHKIYESSDGQHRVLLHGTTVHGAQRVADEDGNPLDGRPDPLTYYHAKSPLAQAIRGVRARKGGGIKVAVIGLGSGSLACYVEPGDTWRFFEIDPSVVDIARDPNRFTFISSCAPDVPIVIGDARLTLAREPDGQFDLIIVDAYSSDAIPIHLATREAMALYKAKLAPDGIVAMHVSNRHLDLASVAVGIAAANDLKAWTYNDEEDDERDVDYTYTSDVVLAAAREEALGEMATNKKWDSTEPDEGERVWTDDYSNIVGALWRKMDWPNWNFWSRKN